MIDNYQNFLLENVSMSLEMVVNIIKSLKGDENKKLVNKLINYSDKNGKTVLMSIVQSNNQELIKYILTLKVDLQPTDKEGRNVLFYCRSMITFKILYDLGANTNTFDKKNGKNILSHLASRNLFNYDIYKELIHNGINVNQIDNYGQSLLCYSILNKKIIQLLVKNDADYQDVDIQDKFTKTLFYAFKYYKNKRKLVLSILDFLFKSGMKIDMNDFSKNMDDLTMYSTTDVDPIVDFIEPLKDNFSDDMLISLFKHLSHSVPQNANTYAKKLLNLGIYPKLYQYLKKYFRYQTTSEEIFKDYLKEHPYVNDVEKYNL